VTVEVRCDWGFIVSIDARFKGVHRDRCVAIGGSSCQSMRDLKGFIVTVEERCQCFDCGAAVGMQHETNGRPCG
jgi:hypothetical protein